MLSMQNRLKALYEELVKLTPPVYHYFHIPDQTGSYIVWAEDTESESLNVDNVKEEQIIHGTIDYFTQTEFDTVVDSIQTTLNSVEDCGWRLNSVQYEEETNYIHYEWEFNIG